MIVDSNILIDLQRNKEQAIQFFKNNKELSISIITSFEIITGFRSLTQLKSFNTFLLENNISILHCSTKISFLSSELFSKYRFINYMDFADVIIAATAYHHKKALATLNVKHFRDIKEIDIIKPY